MTLTRIGQLFWRAVRLRCPNCGGGFAPRPIRPARVWQGSASLRAHPASNTVVHKPVDPVAHAQLRQRIGALAPDER